MPSAARPFGPPRILRLAQAGQPLPIGAVQQAEAQVPECLPRRLRVTACRSGEVARQVTQRPDPGVAVLNRPQRLRGITLVLLMKQDQRHRDAVIDDFVDDRLLSAVRRPDQARPDEHVPRQQTLVSELGDPLQNPCPQIRRRLITLSGPRLSLRHEQRGKAAPRGARRVVLTGHVDRRAAQLLLLGLATAPAAHRLVQVLVGRHQRIAIGQDDSVNALIVVVQPDTSRLPRVQIPGAGGPGFQALLHIRPALLPPPSRLVVLADVEPRRVGRHQVEQESLLETVALHEDTAQVAGPSHSLRIALAALGPRVPHSTRLDAGRVEGVSMYNPARRLRERESLHSGLTHREERITIGDVRDDAVQGRHLVLTRSQIGHLEERPGGMEEIKPLPVTIEIRGDAGERVRALVQLLPRVEILRPLHRIVQDGQ